MSRGRAAGWPRSSGRATIVVANVGASEDITVDVPLGGGYGIWIGGSIRNRLETSVDGEPLSDVRHHLDYPGQYTLLGMAELAAGEHVVSLRHSDGGWRPGSGVKERPSGPLVLSLGRPDVPVTIVPAARRATALRQAPRLDRGAWRLTKSGWPEDSATA